MAAHWLMHHSTCEIYCAIIVSDNIFCHNALDGSLKENVEIREKKEEMRRERKGRKKRGRRRDEKKKEERKDLREERKK